MTRQQNRTREQDTPPNASDPRDFHGRRLLRASQPLACLGKETFIARMSKDARITLPTLTRRVLQGDDDDNLHDYILQVKLEPAP